MPNKHSPLSKPVRAVPRFVERLGELPVVGVEPRSRIRKLVRIHVERCPTDPQRVPTGVERAPGRAALCTKHNPVQRASKCGVVTGTSDSIGLQRQTAIAGT